MLVKTYGAALQGLGAIKVTVEVAVTRGTLMVVVGLPDTAVKESAERVRSALEQSGFEFPRKNVVVNLAPADVRKEGSAFDLPIAVGILAAAEAITVDRLEQYCIMGELGLDGVVRPVRGALPMAVMARDQGFTTLIVPEENAAEAAVVDGIRVYAATSLRQVTDILTGVNVPEPVTVDVDAEFSRAQMFTDMDFSDVKGQENVKRAFEVACAGGHNILLVGPPGAGKSMMAKRLPSIMPPLTLDEALECTKIHSVAGKLNHGTRLLTVRPFRSPHHTVSAVAMVGGGANPMPGEISLAHNGLLFLDEFPEFQKPVLEVLRQPLEDRHITVSRARYTINYPAGFMLVASMNPCPCGYYNHPKRDCTCQPGAVARYKNRISGPLLDRIDLQVEIMPVPFEELALRPPGEESAAIRRRVVAARAIQHARFVNEPGIYCNAQMNSRLMQKHCQLSPQAMDILQRAMTHYDMSARAYDRIRRVARTIADMDNSADILPQHITEAVSYRNLDRASWGAQGMP